MIGDSQAGGRVSDAAGFCWYDELRRFQQQKAGASQSNAMDEQKNPAERTITLN